MVPRRVGPGAGHGAGSAAAAGGADGGGGGAPTRGGGGVGGGGGGGGGLTAVHWAPRIFHYEGFLTEAECDHLLKVGGAAGGGGEPARVQVGRGADSLVTLLERRIATVAFHPVANSRGFVVTHFEAGQRPADGAEGPGFVQAASVVDRNRMEAVVTLFLQAAEEGGETVFPKVNAPGPGESPAASSASCASTGLALKPKRGDALLVYSVDLDNGIEPGAYQIDCPVIKGAKSVATKAIHRAPAHEL